MRRQFLLTLTLVAAVAVAADAQTRRDRSDSATIRFRDRDGRGFAYMFGPGDIRMDLRRGRLGVVVSLAPDAGRDSLGAHIEAVTPGSPADRAGIRSGDIITRINGTRLAVTDAADRDDFESRPGRRLINLASRLEPGDTVRLDVRRDGRTQTFTFAAGESDLDGIVERLRIPGGIREMLPVRPGMPFADDGDGRVRIFSYRNGGLGNIELVRVSPELASGLGISEGLLVVDIGGADTSLGLRTGDVIMTIGGRRPTSPSHAMRILSTYDAEETISFEVMRQRRRQTVTGRLPQVDRMWRVLPNSFEMRIEPFGGERGLAPRMEFQRLPELMDRLRMRELPGIEFQRSPAPRTRIEGKPLAPPTGARRVEADL